MNMTVAKAKQTAKVKQAWMAVALGTLMAGTAIFSSPAWGQAPAGGPNDVRIQADVAKVLDNGHFKNVRGQVQNGVVTLTGTVNTYADKERADSKIHHKKNVLAVRNEIQVAGKEVPDQELVQKLGRKIAYDRVGYGTTTFNAITVEVQNGVVTLGGHAWGPVDRDSAVSLAANYDGVKDVIDNIEVDPVSPLDDETRIAVARTVYGFPSLNKYAIDPAKPIRITVINGNVILSGVVDNQSDKNVAGIEANTVANVFKVVNNLQVAGQREKN